MRVLVTGSHGFVGRWLSKELESAGHEVNEAPHLNVTNRVAVRECILAFRPDAIAHLAAVAFAPDAAYDPQTSYAVAVGGTINVMEAARTLTRTPVVLLTGSSEVYGVPSASDLPLTEESPLAPRTPYALSKAAQESVALAYAARFPMRIVVTRSFTHIGPGQRSVFVVPALAERIKAMALGLAQDIRVGNVDIRRDISDVRDVVLAYRLLLEAAVAGDVPAGSQIVNVCSGSAVSIRWIVDELCRLAGVEPRLRVDEELVRPGEPREVRGDATRIKRLVGWSASTPLAQSLLDIWRATPDSLPATA
jgi:GDP-4-dehydro-6-deoxy-D-mannose reductase